MGSDDQEYKHSASLPLISREGSSDAESEAKCERCGVGCHSVVSINGFDVVVEGLYCKYLEDTGEGPVQDLGRGRFRCSVYEDRFRLAPWCGHSDYAKTRGWLREGCPYAVEVGVTGGKIRLSPKEYDLIWPRILREVLMTDWFDHVSHQSFIDNHLSKREPGNWVAVPGETEGTIAFERDVDKKSAPRGERT